MSEPLNDITKQVMDRIHTEHIKMRPRWYFVLGSLATFVGLVMSILASVFLLSFIKLSLRGGGRLAEYKMDELLSHFSWWGPVIAIASLLMGIWLLRQYEFSYKKNFALIVIGFVLAIVAASFILDMSGLSEVMLQRGPFRSAFPTEHIPYKQTGDLKTVSL
jgi:hypothetical protein